MPSGRQPAWDDDTLTSALKTRETTEPVVVSPSGLDPNLLDEDALRAVERLQARDAEAYLVGGCVRDLLLGTAPKDYDIATSARPAQVKRTFPRNCRIIGRRFKLAHLHYDGNRKILECSTFRRAPEPDETEDTDDADLLITRDNEFGSAEEDAKRRDFTINALFYDPVADRLIDYVGGLEDIEARLIRTIGEPEIRFREDPVRIMRAVKFASRLGLAVEPATFDAMVAIAPDLKRSAPPRVLEEILRLLRGGYALDSFQLLRDLGVLDVILPEVDTFLDDAEREDRVRFWRMLEALDGYNRRSARTPASGVMLSTLFLGAVQMAANEMEDASFATVADEVVQPFAADLRLPRRDAACMKRICSVQNRFLPGNNRKRFKASAFVQDPALRRGFRTLRDHVRRHGRARRRTRTLAGHRERQRERPATRRPQGPRQGPGQGPREAQGPRPQRPSRVEEEAQGRQRRQEAPQEEAQGRLRDRDARTRSRRPQCIRHRAELTASTDIRRDRRRPE